MEASKQYLTQCRDNFNDYITKALLLIEAIFNQEHLSEDDRDALENIKCLVTGFSADEIQRDLNTAIVENSIKYDTIKKFRKLNKDIIGLALEKMQDKVKKEFIKQLCDLLLERDEQTELLRCRFYGVEVK